MAPRAPLCLALAASLALFAGVSEARPKVYVCTAQYLGFDYFPPGSAYAPKDTTNWPIVVPESATKGANPGLVGFDVDLRAKIFGPDHLDMEQEVHVYPSLSEALYAVRNKRCNLTHAPTTITEYRESCPANCPVVPPGGTAVGNNTCCLDFSHQMMETGVAMMLHKNYGGRGSNTVIFDALFSAESLESLLVLLLLVVISGHIFWAIERGGEDADVRKDYAGGTQDGLWWAFVTATTVGYGDLTAKTPAGRCYATVWMVIGLIITGLVLGIIASALTASALIEPIRNLDQMQGKPVCASPFYTGRVLAKYDVVPVTDGFTGCRAKLMAGEVDALIADAPVIEYDLKNAGGGAAGYVKSPFITPVGLGIAFPEKNDYPDSLISVVNPVLLKLQADKEGYTALLAPWFGQAPTTTDEEPAEMSAAVAVPACLLVFGWLIAQIYFWASRRRVAGGGDPLPGAACGNGDADQDAGALKSVPSTPDVSAGGAAVTFDNPAHTEGRGIELAARSGGGGGGAGGADVSALQREVGVLRSAVDKTSKDVASILAMLRAQAAAADKK